MRTSRIVLIRRQAGQSLVETVMTMPVLLLFLFNALNFGYFFLHAINLQSAPRTAAEYSVMGGATPAVNLLPPATSNGSCSVSNPNCSVSALLYQDLAAFTGATTKGAVQVCSQSNGLNSAGTTSETTACTRTSTPGGFSWPSPHSDPELSKDGTARAFALNRVDVAYTFTPLIPGAPFNLVVLGFPSCGGGTVSCCNANGTCIVHRSSEMRVMN
jgi:Flp pilus assembly protein TadG